MPPETKYARSGDVNIAYQVTGNGAIDLVMAPGTITHLEWMWEDPRYTRFIERLGSFARLIRFDKRGTGLSDRVSGVATLEQRMDDIRAVMDAVGSERAALLGISEGGPMSILFAATYPARTSALILCGSLLKPNPPPTPEEYQEWIETLPQVFGTEARARESLRNLAPSVADDDHTVKFWARLSRLGASPGAAIALYRMNMEIDVRAVLPSIRVPTLVLHRAGDRIANVADGRYIAENIPGAKYVELPGDNHLPWVADSDAIINEIAEFLTGTKPVVESDRVLATVMFTDIVGSTERAAAMGDRKWRELLDQHHALIRKELAHFRGREIDTAGDSFLATFDGPARAIRCALAAGDAVRLLGIEIRAGLHTGECELMGNNIGGIAVHIGARVMAKAGANEVLVSSTVKDLVAGSGIQFTDRGMHMLKGVPEEWHLFQVDKQNSRLS